jgi:hypothetical protein
MGTMKNLNGMDLKIEDVWACAFDKEVKWQLCPDALTRVNASRDYIQGKIDNGETMYGVTTGFGAFSDVKISKEQVVELQKNLIRSHSCGIGEPFSKDVKDHILHSLTLPELERVVQDQAKEIITEVAWKVIPEVAEKVIREELNKLLEQEASKVGLE